MTILFWALAALLALGAVGFVAWPLLRGGEAEFSRAARSIRRQITSLDQALADGHIDAERHAARRSALSASLGELVSKPEAGRRSPVVTGILALAIPVAALLVYRAVGTPEALERLGNGPAPSDPRSVAAGEAPPPGLEDAIANLERRLEAEPEDVEGWYLLGQSYMATERFDAAREAYARAYDLAPEEPAVLEMYGNAIAFSSREERIPDRAVELFRQALAVNPDSQRSLYFLGVASYQRGAFAEALLHWERLEGLIEPGSAAAERLAREISAARQQLGAAPSVASLFPTGADDAPATPAEAPAAPPGAGAPSAEPRDGAAGAELTVEVSLDASLADRVTDGDILFVFARAAEGPRMPLAIQRLSADQLPARVTLDESMAMTPALTLGTFPQVVVGARISKSGDATPQPGDLEAVSDPIPSDSGQVVRLNIDRVL